ncbi:MAG: glycosyltransferase family 4 protein [Deltaproteobacteria bacterium]|nr:glycosyltransferase family 4 protein [Deltaproteobacteria bacterium]
MRVLVFGSDPGTLKGPSHPTYRRLRSYAKRVEWLGILNYSSRNHKPFADREAPLFVYPSNSCHKFTYPLDALIMGNSLIKKHDVAVLVSQDPFVFGVIVYLLSAWHKIPFITHIHADMVGNKYWLREKLSHRILDHIARFVIRKAKIIRTVSTKISENLLKMGCPPGKIFYVSPPVNPLSFGSTNLKVESVLINKYRLNKNETFIFIGRLSYQKNVDMILKASSIVKKIYPNHKILLIGEGPEKKALMRKAESLEVGGNVLFLGEIPYQELGSHLKVSLALVLTSFYEGAAKVIKEAAFAGKPVITTDTSGISDTIEGDRTGLVVPIGDFYALAKSMRYLLKNRYEADRMGEKARHYMHERFDYQNDIDRIVDVWRRIESIGKGDNDDERLHAPV